MLVPPRSPDLIGSVVDAAHDKKYCPHEMSGNGNKPKVAPRSYPPKPKPRSGIDSKKICFFPNVIVLSHSLMALNQDSF